MQYENTGKTITNIKISKKKVGLYFKSEKMDISLEAYTSMNLFIGRTLTPKEINDLKRMSNLDKGLGYALSLLKKSIYSEWKMREKLYQKELDKKDVDAIIKFLKQHDLINDDAFILDYLYEAEEKGYGKYKIIQKLNEKGIFEDKIKKIKFSDSKELKKAKALLPSLEKKYSSLNSNNKKRHIYDAYIRLGYDSNIINQILPLIKTSDIKKELSLLKKDYAKYKIKAKNKYVDDKYKQREYLISKLLNLGYKYKDILNIVEDELDDLC